MKWNSLTRTITVALALLAIATSITLLHVSAGPIQNSNTATAFMLPAGQQFTNAGRQLVSFSPDGTRIVYVANTQLYINRVGEKTSRAIPGTFITQGVTNATFHLMADR